MIPPTAGPPQLYTRADVAQLLGVPVRELTWWIWALRPSRRYDRFEVARRNGATPRIIHAPIKPIKDLQRRFADLLLSVYEPQAHVHGFVAGRSPLTNAQQHERQRWLMKLDLDEFFPSINFGRVRGMFMAYPFEYPPEVATTLAQLCCFENQLPQGAPTSPIVSNFICLGLDADLARLARAERCRFTRYADDICFSTNHVRFPSGLATIDFPNGLQVGEKLRSVIVGHGFDISPEKTRLVRRTRRQRVTGLVVNRRANVPNEYVRSLRNLLFIWAKYGETEAAAALLRHEPSRNRPPAKGEVNFKTLVRGRVQYVGSVKGWSNGTYRALASSLAAVDSGFHPRTAASLSETQIVRIYTEGESDALHLRAAHRYFTANGEFTRLDLRLPDDSAAGGDSRLMAKLQELTADDQAAPCICIFDRDNHDAITKAVGTTSSKRWSPDVAAMVIAAPDWRDQRVCIEMLYSPSDLLRRDASGRRLYLAEEFDPNTGQHASEDVHVANPDRGKPNRPLVREEVYLYGTGESVGLTKMDFAEDIYEARPGFEDVDFEGFRETFEVLEQAVVRLLPQGT